MPDHPEVLYGPWRHDDSFEVLIRAGTSGPELDWRVKPDGEWELGEHPSLETQMAVSELVLIWEEFSRAQEHAQIDSMRIAELESERDRLRNEVEETLQGQVQISEGAGRMKDRFEERLVQAEKGLLKASPEVSRDRNRAHVLMRSALNWLSPDDLPPGPGRHELAILCQKIWQELEVPDGQKAASGPVISIEVEPGKVVLNDLWLIVDRPEVKIISGDSRTKNAEVIAIGGGSSIGRQVILGLTECSVHAGEEGPDWTKVNIDGLSVNGEEYWRVDAIFTRYNLTIWCWLESGVSIQESQLLWDRGGRNEP